MLETNQSTNVIIDASTYKLSWEVYLKQIVFTLIISLILFSLTSSHWTFYILLVLFLVWMSINIWRTLSYKVFLDNEGIWIESGVLPWEKGTYGTPWRDVSGASYKTGFLSWILKSYSVSVNHRFTKDRELYLSNIKHGNNLVLEINRIVSELNLY